MKHALTSRLESGGSSVSVRFISPLYFVATKIEAFGDRGKGDFFASHDMEDIVAVLTASSSVRTQIASSRSQVCGYIRAQLLAFRDDESFRDAALGHLAGDERAYDRLVGWLRELE